MGLKEWLYTFPSLHYKNSDGIAADALADGREGVPTGTRKASVWHKKGSPNMGQGMLAPNLSTKKAKEFDANVLALVQAIGGKWGGGTLLEIGVMKTPAGADPQAIHANAVPNGETDNIQFTIFPITDPHNTNPNYAGTRYLPAKQTNDAGGYIPYGNLECDRPELYSKQPMPTSAPVTAWHGGPGGVGGDGQSKDRWVLWVLTSDGTPMTLKMWALLDHLWNAEQYFPHPPPVMFCPMRNETEANDVKGKDNVRTEEEYQPVAKKKVVLLLNCFDDMSAAQQEIWWTFAKEHPWLSVLMMRRKRATPGKMTSHPECICSTDAEGNSVEWMDAFHAAVNLVYDTFIDMCFLWILNTGTMPVATADSLVMHATSNTPVCCSVRLCSNPAQENFYLKEVQSYFGQVKAGPISYGEDWGLTSQGVELFRAGWLKIRRWVRGMMKVHPDAFDESSTPWRWALSALMAAKPHLWTPQDVNDKDEKDEHDEDAIEVETYMKRFETAAHSPVLYNSECQSRPILGEDPPEKTLSQLVAIASNMAVNAYFFTNCFGRSLSVEELRRALPNVVDPVLLETEGGDADEPEDEDVATLIDLFVPDAGEMDKLRNLVSTFLEDTEMRENKYTCLCEHGWKYSPMKDTDLKVLRALSSWVKVHEEYNDLLPDVFYKSVHKNLMAGRAMTSDNSNKTAVTELTTFVEEHAQYPYHAGRVTPQ
jgi:hypothetical protein